MSDSVVKLRIDSKEYDANIKRAGQALTDYFNKVKESGGTLKYLDEGVLEAVQAMGKLGTQASSVKGGLRELTQATSDMTVAYRSLTDEEKASPIGAAMAESIQQMTERAGEMRDAMDDVQASINNAASDTRQFDQVAGAMQAATAGFQTVTGAAKLMGIQMGDDVEVIAKLQAAMAVTSGFQTMQNLLQKQSALMQGVNALQKEFNILAKANPYVLLATAAAAVVAAYVAWTSGARDAEKAQKALNGEIEATRTQLSQIDKDTDFSVGVAEAAGKSWKAIHELRLEAARTKLQLADMNYDKLAASGVASAEQMKKAAEMQQQAWDNVMKVLNEGTIHDVKMRNGGGGRTGGGRTGGSRSGGGSSKEQTEEQMNNAQIEKLTQEYIKASDDRRQAIEREIEVLQKRNEEIAKLKDMAHGKAFEAGEIGEVVVTGSKMAKVNKDFRENGASEAGLSSYISSLKSAISQEDLGSELFNNLTSKLQDATMMQQVLQAALSSGASAVDLSGIAKEIKQKMMEGDVDDSTWQDFLDKINEKIENADLKLVFDVDTNSIITAAQKVNKEVMKIVKSAQMTANVVGSIGDAFNAIEDPAAKVAGTVAQAIATVAAGYATATLAAAETGNPWVWVAFAASGLAQMLTMINTIHSATGYAEGGVVKGNHYSGDMLDGGSFGINAGELVLNRAQQGSLASQLEGGGLRNLRLSAEVKGEQIVLVANRYFKRTGQGEIVTWK